MSTSHHLEGHRRSAHRAAHPQRALGEAPRRCGDRRIRPRRTLALHRAKDLLPQPRILEVQGLLVQGMLVQGRVSMLPLARNRTTGQRWLALRTSRPQPRRGVKDRSVKERLEHIEYGLVSFTGRVPTRGEGCSLLQTVRKFREVRRGLSVTYE